MSWTAQHEAEYARLHQQEVEIREARCAMHAAGCALMEAIVKAHKSINGYETLLTHVRQHGAELIALIEPFVGRADQQQEQKP
jgi:hypothetical protein